eukprot:scpid82772/ scgid15866/ 
MSAHLTVHDLLVHATILLVCSSFAAPQPIQKGLNTMEQYYQEKVVEKESYKVVESYLGICGIFPCPLFRVQCDSVHRRQQYRPKWVLCLGGRNLNGPTICRLTLVVNAIFVAITSAHSDRTRAHSHINYNFFWKPKALVRITQKKV